MRAARIWQPGEGETVRLGTPSSVELVVTVDPQRDSTGFAVGQLTLAPGGGLPALRHLERDLVLVVQKGQGRATVGDQRKTVLPGMAVTVPRGVWHEVRNTGTGLFQCVWVSAPPGLEAYFRELAQAGPSAGASAAHEIARRHGVEFREAGFMAPAATPTRATPPDRSGRRGGRHRRRGRGRPRAAAHTAPAASPPSAPPVASAPSPPAAPPPAPRPAPRKPTSPRSRPERRGRRYGRVKEVYMEGRWVSITGDGPVVST